MFKAESGRRLLPHIPLLPNDSKQAETEVRSREVRLARALEEVERYKALLQEVKAQVRGHACVGPGGEASHTGVCASKISYVKYAWARLQLLPAWGTSARVFHVQQPSNAYDIGGTNSRSATSAMWQSRTTSG